MIDFNRRFWPAYNHVRKYVRDQDLGVPVQLEYGLHLNVRSWSNVTGHRLEAIEGGVLHDLGCHAIDVVMQIIGAEPNWVRATRTGGDSQNCRVQMQFEFPNGCSASCDIAYGKRTCEWLILRGPRGKLRLADPNMALHFTTAGAQTSRPPSFSTKERGRSGRDARAPHYELALPFSARLQDALTLAYRGVRRSKSMARASIGSALAAFLEAVKTGQPFSPGFEEGLRNLRWIAAAEESITTKTQRSRQ